MEEKITVTEFINKFLIKGVNELIEKDFHYFAFVLIGQGIEFLGSFYDKELFEKNIPDGRRFKNALSHLFKDSFYRQNQDWLYHNLRCSLIHQIRPSKELFLTSYKLNKFPKDKHLKKIDSSNCRVFVIECLYDDFKFACENLIKKIKSKDNSLDAAKLSTEYISIFPLLIDNINYEVTGSTMYNVSVIKT